MSIQTNSPSTNLGTSVSADGIATTLGYADAATLTAAIDAGVPQALDTTDSPQFAGINLGHASDTTLTRTGAGVAAIEGAEITTNTGTQTLTNKSIVATQLTGTVAAARLPGVLADVDTQAELLSAAGAAAASHTHAAVCCQCSIDAYQNLTSATDNLVVFQQHDLITDATLHSTSSNKSRFVAPTGLGGKYKLTVNLTVENSGGAFCTYTLRWLKNGSIVRTLKGGQLNGGNEHLLSSTYIFDLADGDYAEFAINPSQSSNYIAFGADGTASVINSTACFERIGT